jgi:hypothetical protein
MPNLVAPPNGSVEWARFYGDFPGIYNDQTRRYEYDPQWWRFNVVQMELPFVLRIAWDRIHIVKRISVNWRIEEPLRLVFDEIVKKNLTCHVCEYGGTSSLRKVRGGAVWSTHSWIAAIDLNPGANPLGEKPTMNRNVVSVFEDHGFTWGGWFSRQDGMHFQYGRDF